MKTAIVYYTFGGATKREAERLAAETGAQLCRVAETRKRGLFGAFLPGAFQARRREKTAIEPLDIDLNGYDRIVIGCPIWGGYPAPPFNAVAELLPAGKEVEVFLCSTGGNTKVSEAGTRALIREKGCQLALYRDVRTGANPGKLKE